MIKTVHFSELTKRTDDLFELVVASAKRTRQINSLRIAKNPLPTLNEDEEETFDETPEEEDLTDWDSIEKPTTLALNEMLSGNLSYKYIGEDQEEESDSEFAK